MLQEHKDALPPDLLAQIKIVLNHHNPTKFAGHVVEAQRRQARVYGNYASVENNIPKVECALNK